MHRTLVLNVVGLTPELLGEHTPHLLSLAEQGYRASLDTITPAVTCSVQSTFVTGLPVSGHGIVGNGWYFKDLAEVSFWRQSNALVQGEKLWDTAKRKDPSFTVAKLFWWYNMYSSADLSVTPRPMYPADGRKLPDIYTQPAGLRDELQQQLGQFPLFNFWGPMAGIVASDWIKRCALAVERERKPTLSLVYLPHLDYALQKLGPNHPDIAQHLRQIDQVCGELLENARAQGLRVIVLSEYGITPVSGAIHVNRALREAGLLAVREEQGRELLDAGASRAFAVADHQVAHIYVAETSALESVRALVQSLDGVERVLNAEGKGAFGLDHERSGDLVAISKSDRWFSYYYWLSDGRAPDFARTVDIHRKPGYDPVELFLDPKNPFIKLKIFAKLALRGLGFRNLLDVIPLDASLVKGSHGRVTDDPRKGPLFISSEPDLMRTMSAAGIPGAGHGAGNGSAGDDSAGEDSAGHRVAATDVKDLILRHVFDDA